MIAAKTDVVAVIRAPLENYPPSLNQIQLLCERERRVLAIDVAPENQADCGLWTHPNLRRLRVGCQGRPRSFVRRLLNHLHFRGVVRSALWRERPRVVIAYDPNGMIAAGLPDAFNIWHFHELFDTGGRGGFLTKRAIGFAESYADHADMVIFPDAARKDLFKARTGLSAEPAVIHNCPRRLEMLPADRLRPALYRHGVPESARLVLFQGCIGPSHCLEPVIAGMSGWPGDARLVLIGPVEESYRAKLTCLAADIGVGERVIFLGRVPYADLFGYTVGADIGLSIQQTDRSLNLKYTAGASNKRFEYMAVGLPQITNRGPGMVALIEETGVGRLVRPEDAGEIGRAVAGMLADRSALDEMSRRARAVHLERFYYETQFVDALNKLDEVLEA